MDLKDSAQGNKSKRFKTLIIGGYGNFGHRIAKSLAKESYIQVILAGRNRLKAIDAAQKLSRVSSLPVQSLEIDINSPLLTEKLQESKAALVIHTSGPFQKQGYAVAEACIHAGVHYIDLADGRSFVEGFQSLDELAKNNAVIAITGASSVPGLSSAVINHYRSQFKELQALRFGIAPGNQTERGEATVKAILSYTGKRFQRWQNQSWQSVLGWQDLHLHNFPTPIGKRWLSNCDIPDLSIFPQKYPELQSIKFYAGLELGILHIGLWGLSWLVRLKLIKSLAQYSGLLTRMSTWVQTFGSDVGGMYVELEGKDLQNKPHKVLWNLIAESGDGPHIPTIPSIILAKKIALGEYTQTGAITSTGLFSLEEFSDEVATLDIHQQITFDEEKQAYNGE